jgi:peptidase inhibitor family I36
MDASPEMRSATHLLSLLLVTGVISTSPAGAAGVGAGTPRCVGLNCSGPASPDYVPEANGDVRAAAGLDELNAESRSGFYEIPAPMYQGDVPPRAVVYLAKAGQVERMPASVRNLPGVRDELTSGLWARAATLVVIHRGVIEVMSAPAMWPVDQWNACGDKAFCLWDGENGAGFMLRIPGPEYVGSGWWNLSSSVNNWANSMVNRRDGDSLLADGAGGTGARYCARQQSIDATFSNNFGNNVASSFALLGSGIDRC